MKMTKKDLVYEGLKKSIDSGEIAPDEKITISEQARKFNVSKIPVREAVNLLASEGILEFLPSGRVVVVSLTKDDIAEIFQLKEELESLATKLAVNNISNAHIHELEQIIEESTKCIETKDSKVYRQFNRKFHDAINRHCGNKRLHGMINDLWDTSTRYPMPYATVEQIEKSIAEHHEIVDALRKRDEILAETLVKNHKNRSFVEVLADLDKLSKEKGTVVF